MSKRLRKSETPADNKNLVRCLGNHCGNALFVSRDRTRNRICPICRVKQDRVSIPRVARLGTLPSGRPVAVHHDD